MGDNNWWWNRSGAAAPVSNPGSATPNYGLTFDLATAPYDSPDQFDGLAEFLSSFATQVGAQLAPAIPGGLTGKARDKTTWDFVSGAGSSAWEFLTSRGEDTQPKGLIEGVENLSAEDQARLNDGEVTPEELGLTVKAVDTNSLADAPVVKQIFWGLDKVNEYASTAVVATTLAEDDFGKLFEAGTWGDAQELTKERHLNFGEAVAQTFYDKEVLQDEQRFEQIRAHNTAFNFGALALNVIGAWKADPNVFLGKAAGAARDQMVGKLAVNGRTAEIQRSILSAPDMETAAATASQYTKLADRLRAGHAVSLFDRSLALRESARTMGFEEFSKLPAFTNSASGTVMAKLMQDVAESDENWNLVFRTAIGDPDAVGELIARQGEISDKIAAIELKTSPRLQADLERTEARYQKRLAEQGKPQDARIEITRFGDKWLEDEITTLRAEADSMKAHLATYTHHESWLQRALPGVDLESKSVGRYSPNSIFGNLDRVGGKGMSTTALGGKVSFWQHDQFSPVSRVLRAPSKPMLKRVGAVSLNDVNEGAEALTGYLDQLDYIRGGATDAVLRDRILSDFAGSTTDMQRKRIVEQVEREGVMALGVRHGLSQEVMSEFAKALQEKRKATWGKLSDQAIYSPIAGKNGPGYAEIVDDFGNVNRVKMPVDPTQLSNFHSLVNLTDLDKAIRQNLDLLRDIDADLVSLRKAGLSKGKRWSADLIEELGTSFNQFWKPLALISVRWPVRVVADESMRVMLLTGVLPHLAGIPTGVKNAVYNAGVVRPYEWWNGRRIKTGSLSEASLRSGARNNFDPYDYRAITNPTAVVPVGEVDFGKLDTRRYEKLNAVTASRWQYLRKLEAAGAWRRDAAAKVGMTREEFEATGSDLLHGTTKDFDRFGAAADRNGVRQDGQAFYFTEDPAIADKFGPGRAYGEFDPSSLELRSAGIEDMTTDEFRSFLREKKVDTGLQRMDDDGNWVDVTVDEVTADDIEGGLRRLVHPKARVIGTKVYGKTLDLGAPKIQPGLSAQAFHARFKKWFDGLPEDVQNFFRTSEGPTAKAVRRTLRGTDGEYGFNWREHTGDKDLLKFARENGYGKIRVPDNTMQSGDYSFIGLNEYIAHNRDVVGEFFPKTDWPEMPTWARQWDERLAEAEKTEARGFFFDPVTRKASNRGFAVSVYPGRLRTFDRKPTAREMNYWVEKNSDLLGIPQNRVAVWLDKDTKRWHLDVVKTTRRREDAMLLAGKAEASEFFDIEDGFTRYVSEDFYQHFSSPFFKADAEAPAGVAYDQAPLTAAADDAGAAIGAGMSTGTRPVRKKVGFGSKTWRTRDGRSVTGEQMYGPDTDNPNIYFGTVSSREAMQNLYGGYTRTLSRERQRAGADWRYFDPAEDPEAWAKAWAQQVNRHVRYSPITQRMLEGETDEQIYDWLMGTAKGRELRKRIPVRAQNPAQWVSDSREIFDHMFPTDAAVEAARLGEIGERQALDLIPDDLRGTVHGDTVALALGSHSVTSTYNAVVNKLMEYLGSVPTDALVRHPFAARVYDREMRSYLSSVEGGKVTNNVLAAAEASARAKALRQVKRTLYNIADEREGVHMLRFVSPFFQAQVEVLERYARISMEKPETLARIAQLLVGSQTLQSPFWEVTTFDGKPAEGYENDNLVTFQVTEGMRDLVDKIPGLKGALDNAGDITIPVASLNLILQGEKPYLPSLGPIVTFPASEFYFKDKPELSESAIYSWMFPFGEPRGSNSMERAFNALAPAYLRRGVADISDPAFARRVGEIHAQLLMEWERTGKDGPRPTGEDALEATKNEYRLRAAASFFLPAPVTPRSPFQFWIDMYRDYKSRYGAEADEKFYDEVGPDYFLFAQQATQATGGMGPNVGEKKAYDAYKSLIGRAPLLTGVLTGPFATGEFSDSVYQWQLRTPVEAGSSTMLRERLDPSERIADAQISRGWVEYGKLMSAIDAEIRYRASQGKSAYITSSDNADLAEKKTLKLREIIERNPAWQDAYNSRSSSLGTWLGQAYDVAFDPKLDGRTDMEALRAYLIGRARLQDALIERQATGQSSSDQLSFDPLGRPIGDNADMGAAWLSWINETKAQNPLFAEIYNRYLEGDDLSIYIAPEVSGASSSY